MNYENKPTLSLHICLYLEETEAFDASPDCQCQISSERIGQILGTCLHESMC